MRSTTRPTGSGSALAVFEPAESAAAAPVLIYFFGGGWTLGTLDTCDPICRALTNRVGCVTVAVGYRLAPEHRFPAAVLDCRAAVRWIGEHAAELGADRHRMAVGGDSAGGNLAAVMTLMARDGGGPEFRSQILIYIMAGTGPLRELGS
ncbi:alpha/beta hydrolase [Nocardia sp. NPDC101769]|uniref:alpha/beta hydrolase n=1 Tax=Nocardia sp. NPDC101769 TaxID=3364333 RepID=UPI00380ADC6C